MSHSARSAFSLVELSIVLVILGLLTGGILSGQSLIRAAELRSVTTDVQRYQAALHSFRDKYRAIPGDFRDATRFWGRLTNTADCVTRSSATVATPGACDGNGDGAIGNAAAASQSSESAQMWRHLALAGLIEGDYSGLAGAGGIAHCVLGTNCPRSKLSNSGWGVFDFGGSSSGSAVMYAIAFGHVLAFGGQTTTTIPETVSLKPEEAWNIDIKIDDGKPARGKVVARHWNNACAAADDGTHANDDLNASYKVSDTSLQCVIYFRNIF